MTPFADTRSDLHDDFGVIEAPTPDAIRAAQLQAVAHGRTADERAEFLAMITDPGWGSA